MNAAPATYKAYQPNKAELAISELSTGRCISLSEAQGLVPSTDRNLDGVSPIINNCGPVLSSESIRTRPNTVFALTPLMTRFQTHLPSTGDTPIKRFFLQPTKRHADSDTDGISSENCPVSPIECDPQASIYVNPAARVTGPLTWPEPLNLRRGSDRLSINTGRGVTDASGGREKYVSPETAMSDGFTAGPENGDEIAVVSVESCEKTVKPREVCSHGRGDQEGKVASLDAPIRKENLANFANLNLKG